MNTDKILSSESYLLSNVGSDLKIEHEIFFGKKTKGRTSHWKGRGKKTLFVILISRLKIDEKEVQKFR